MSLVQQNHDSVEFVTDTVVCNLGGARHRVPLGGHPHRPAGLLLPLQHGAPRPGHLRRQSHLLPTLAGEVYQLQYKWRTDLLL